jgi:hypothetical protein
MVYGVNRWLYHSATVFDRFLLLCSLRSFVAIFINVQEILLLDFDTDFLHPVHEGVFIYFFQTTLPVKWICVGLVPS